MSGPYLHWSPVRAEGFLRAWKHARIDLILGVDNAQQTACVIEGHARQVLAMSVEEAMVSIEASETQSAPAAAPEPRHEVAAPAAAPEPRHEVAAPAASTFVPFDPSDSYGIDDYQEAEAPDLGPPLSPDQQEAKDRILSAIRDLANHQKNRVLVLSGAAGTGKTTLVRRLLSSLSGMFVLYAAPTGKAASRLSQVTGQPCVTVHSLIYARPTEQGKCPKCEKWSEALAISNYDLTKKFPLGERFRVCPSCNEKFDVEVTIDTELRFSLRPEGPNGEIAFGENTVIVVDEASMVTELMHSDLIYAISHLRRAHLLFVGDPYQLPPVDKDGTGGRCGPDFEHPTACLTHIHRQALDSPILSVATDLRTTARQYPFDNFQGKSGDFRIYQNVEVDAPAQWLADRRAAGIDATLITYTNALRQVLNNRVRELRGLTALAEKQGTGIVAGDRLLVRANNRGAGFLNGEVVEVEHVEWVEPMRKVKEREVLRVYLVGRADPIYVPEATFGDHFREFASYLKGHEKAWESATVIAAMENDTSGAGFAELLDPSRFVHVDWGETVTAHASQGSQWEEVGIAWNKSMWGFWFKGGSSVIQGQSVSEGRRWTYTAVTRAQKKLSVFFVKAG